MAKTKRVIAGANTITDGIVATLLIDGHSASRINVQGQWDQELNEGRGAWRKSGSRKGFGDISVTIKPHGRHLVVEVKFEEDTQSPDQKTFQKEHEAAGGIYLIIKTWRQWLEWYQIFKDNNFIL